MRAVWITTSVPHPAGAGGSAHEFELIQALQRRGHELHVVTSHFDSHLGPEPLLATGATFRAVRWQPRAHPTSKVGVARELVRADPNVVIWLGRDRIPELATAVAEVAAAVQPDVVQITHGELAALLPLVPGPTALLLFDALTRAASTRLAVEPLARRRAQLHVERARTLRFERNRYARASGIASVSEVDAAWLRHELGRPVAVLENPVGDQFFEAPTVERSSGEVVFVGALTHHPNTDAIRWLATDIWPRVAAAAPAAHLRVVGRGDGDPTVGVLRALVEGAGGSLDADVDDIRPSYWRAAVVAAPLRQGSGLRNKVIHAMACRAPVVATAAAVEGVPADAVAGCWIASRADEVATAIVAALADPEEATRRAAVARAGVEVLRVGRVAERHERWWRELCPA